jgi:tetratricopeptide (TPR) repeat protein
VTFSADIAPILFEKCGGCHRPQGSAPFSLLTYASARQRANLIARATAARLMPPWKSEPGYGEFIGHTPLTSAEIETIARWAAGGAPEGEPRDLPQLPTWTDGWQLGTPSMIASLPRPYVVPADGADFSRTFVIRLPVTTATYVKGLDFRPGAGGVVHHANIRVDATPRSRLRDDQDPEVGFSGLLPSSAAYPDGHFLGWTPGQVAPLLPAGLAWRLNPGTDLVVEIHFVPNGKLEPVQPSVGLYFSEQPPERTPAMLRLGRQSIDLPAGEKHYVSSDSFVLPVDAEVQAVQPHAHHRAREVQGTATLPDGTSEPLIYIKDWDYRWQHVYRYVTPLSLPKGTRIDLRFLFDNSAENPRNPQQPPQPVHWGQRSTDEMGDLWVQMLTRTVADLEVLQKALHAKHAAEEIVGYETMIRFEPSNVDLRNDVAVLYTETGQPARAVTHLLAVVQQQPDSPAAHYNLGTVLSSTGRVTEAIEQYQQALRLQPDYGSAHNNLGHALLATGRTDDALQHFREAVRLDPQNGGAHYNIGTLAIARGNVSEAIDHFRAAVRLQPDSIQATVQLAWTLATARTASPQDVDEAIGLADRAAAVTRRQDARILEVLAAAEAAAGHFERAVATSDEALALTADGPLAAGMRQRRGLYVQHQAYFSR